MLRVLGPTHLMAKSPVSCRGGLWLLIAAWSLLSISSAFAASAAASSVTADRVVLSIDGVPCGNVKSWSGGDPRGIVGASGAKHIVGQEFAPLTLEFVMIPPAPVLEWIRGFTTNQAAPRRIILTECDANMKPIRSVELDEAALTEVTFSALDGAAKSSAMVTLVIRPSYRVKIAPTDIKLPAVPKSMVALSSNFRFSIPNLPSTRIARIETITLAVAPGFTATTVKNLLVTMSALDAQPWNDWRDAVFGFGSNPPITRAEKTAELVFLGPNMRTELLTLRFDGVSLIGVAASGNATAETIARVQLELACDRAAVVTPGTP